MTQVSFIVPVFNGALTLRPCLEALVAQETELSFEVIVVDNASTDESAEIIKTYPVKYLFESAKGRSQARNGGARIASGEWLAFIDCDVILDSNWLTNIICALQLRGGTGAQGPIIPDGSAGSFLQRLRSDQRTTFNLLELDLFIHPMINTAACIYQRKAFFDVGGFDPKLSVCEDADLAWKVWVNGGTFVAVDNARGRVYWDKSLVAYLIRSFNMGKGHAQLYRFWNIKTDRRPIHPYKLDMSVSHNLLQALWHYGFYVGSSPRSFYELSEHQFFRRAKVTPSVRIMLSEQRVLVLNSTARFLWQTEHLFIFDCLMRGRLRIKHDDQTPFTLEEIIKRNVDPLCNAGLATIQSREET